VVLDINLPGSNGFTICQQVRSARPRGRSRRFFVQTCPPHGAGRPVEATPAALRLE
jgi:CheY-like chemotaxis protein